MYRKMWLQVWEWRGRVDKRFNWSVSIFSFPRCLTSLCMSKLKSVSDRIYFYFMRYFLSSICECNVWLLLGVPVEATTAENSQMNKVGHSLVYILYCYSSAIAPRGTFLDISWLRNFKTYVSSLFWRWYLVFNVSIRALQKKKVWILFFSVEVL